MIFRLHILYMERKINQWLVTFFFFFRLILPIYNFNSKDNLCHELCASRIWSLMSERIGWRVLVFPKVSTIRLLLTLSQNFGVRKPFTEELLAINWKRRKYSGQIVKFHWYQHHMLGLGAYVSGIEARLSLLDALIVWKNVANFSMKFTGKFCERCRKLHVFWQLITCKTCKYFGGSE